MIGVRFLTRMTAQPAPGGWTDEYRRLVFATVGKEVTSPADRALFEEVCISTGLNPTKKEIYPVVRGGKMSCQTGIDGYLKLANSTGELDGLDVLYYDSEGNATPVWLLPKPPTACLVNVWRKGRSRPFPASCRFEAYSQGNSMWRKFGETMLAKCTTTLALRRAFADLISGLESADEMDQAGLAEPELLRQGLPAGADTSPPVAPAPARPAAPAAAPAPVREPVGAVAQTSNGASAPAPSVDAAAEQLARSTGGTVVAPPPPAPEQAPAPAGDPLPARDDLTGAVGAFYKAAQLAGLTVQGWATVAKACGGTVTPDMAASMLRTNALADPARVTNYNQGLNSRGEVV